MDSVYTMVNMGTVLYICLAYLVIIFIERVMAMCTSCSERSHRWQRKLSSFMYWNALNTLAFEIYLEAGLSAGLNY